MPNRYDIGMTQSTYSAASDRYTKMPYRHCGRSGLKMPQVSIGGWHNFQDVDFVRRLLCRAFDLGVNCIDLANNYGTQTRQPGIAETNTGIILKNELKAHRDELLIATKAGYDMWAGPFGSGGSRKYLLASLDQSLKRLQLDYVDIFYHHVPDVNAPVEESMGALEQAVKSGKALYAGISNYGGEITNHAAGILQQARVPLVVNQSYYSMLNRGVEDQALDACDRAGIGFVAFCPLAQGVLTDRYLKDIPPDSRAGCGTGFLKKDQITPALRNKVIALNEIAQRRGQTLAGMSLTWLLKRSTVCSVLVGASKVEQLEANVRETEKAITFSSEELAQIDQVLNS